MPFPLTKKAHKKSKRIPKQDKSKEIQKSKVVEGKGTLHVPAISNPTILSSLHIMYCVKKRFMVGQ